MARDLNFPLELIACPIVRDGDGLALSSRNRYLTAEERAQALILPRTLDDLAQRIAAGERDAATLIAAGHAVLQQQPAAVLDYLVLVDPDSLLPVPLAVPGSLVAIAAKIGTTRLIDNFLVA